VDDRQGIVTESGSESNYSTGDVARLGRQLELLRQSVLLLAMELRALKAAGGGVER
jgi:hypothetical protein